MEKYEKYMDQYSNLYYENILQIHYTRTGSRRESSFLKTLEKNEMSLITEKHIKKLKELGYNLSHTGNLEFTRNMVNKQTRSFQEWEFLVFHSESGNFFIFMQKNKIKYLDFFKFQWHQEISQVLTAKKE